MEARTAPTNMYDRAIVAYLKLFFTCERCLGLFERGEEAFHLEKDKKWHKYCFPCARKLRPEVHQ